MENIIEENKLQTISKEEFLQKIGNKKLTLLMKI